MNYRRACPRAPRPRQLHKQPRDSLAGRARSEREALTHPLAALRSMLRSERRTSRSRQPSISTVEDGCAGQGSGAHGSRITGGPTAAPAAATATKTPTVMSPTFTDPIVRAREPVNWRAAVAAPRRSQAYAAGLASPLPALRLRHGTRARGESTPARHSKSTRQHFTVRIKCHCRTQCHSWTRGGVR
jgi:hypothetical protein